MLCSTKYTGSNFSCIGMENAQDPKTGRFYRDQWHKEYVNGSGSSFSRDMATGLNLGFSRTKNADSLKRFFSYINSTGYLCTDFPYDERCEIRAPLYCQFEFLAEKMGIDKSYLPTYEVVKPPMKKEWVEDLCKHFEDMLLAEAMTTKEVSPLNLLSLQILTRRNLGYDFAKLKPIAEIIFSKRKENLFFEYLANGISDDLVDRVIAEIPNPPVVEQDRNCWR